MVSKILFHVHPDNLGESFTSIGSFERLTLFSLPSFLHTPGPIIESRTGKKTMPWRTPSITASEVILKNVSKIYDDVKANPRTPREVEMAPCRMGRPRAYRDSLTLSSGDLSWCCIKW